MQAMKPRELKKAIRAKTIEFELALAAERPYDELKILYQQLKELQYQLVQAEHNLETA
jgi:hypothetical protein